MKDPAAVIQFPNAIRLDNNESRIRNRRYIIAESLGAIRISGVWLVVTAWLLMAY